MMLIEMVNKAWKIYDRLIYGKGNIELDTTGKRHPTADGTFIQLGMTYEWDDMKWQKEFRYLKEVGMHYLVVMGITNSTASATETCYPSQLARCKMITSIDVVDILLRNAEWMGIKVFLGIDFNDEWWKKAANNPEWIYEQMQRGNLIADELFKLYHSKYPNAFYGWYWVYEANNWNFRTKKHILVLSNALNIQLDFLKDKQEKLPFMISPFINSIFSSPQQYAKGWKFLFKSTRFEEGDIFCPQDSVGAGGVKLEDVKLWFSAFREAAASKPGLRLWANVENFDQSSWTSAPLSRFVRQMKMEGPYVDNIITFSYSHYYSPNNIDPGFHNTYAAYVKTGTLENQAPSSPKSIEVVQFGEKQLRVSWGPSKDNIGICGYQLYRNSRLIFTCEVQRKYGGEKEGLRLFYVDSYPKIFKWCKVKLVYEVMAFDFAGNISEPARIEIVI